MINNLLMAILFHPRLSFVLKAGTRSLENLHWTRYRCDLYDGLLIAIMLKYCLDNINH